MKQDFKDEKIRNMYRLKKLKEGFKLSTTLYKDKSDRLTI